MNLDIENGDIVILKASDKIYRSRISKVDGNVVKLLDENGSYRQIPTKSLEDMINSGFASIKKHTHK
ncbi:hypothetical protein K8M07_04190 [Schnuerera sp. xch1]|uniref:hypothetical protein n=1 Tax=Schnuerera sp. xch1 TaxID=2874283 RepID=UPI001CBAD49C|nr:hypothetical protein [Schnuerera sp. xch1]MBZ2174442.1 hypothetical protein [Schnuerera sp. xch1]